MSDRIKGYVVTLTHDIKDDDAYRIQNAIGMITGVLSVTPSVVDHNDRMNREKIRHEMEVALRNAISMSRPVG